MTFKVFAIRDTKIGFGQPMLFDNEMVAKRYFAKCINDPGSMLEFAPGDYELYEIGSYQTDSGEFKPVLANFVCAGKDVYGDAK